ncbi:DEAD/DEAH box helicase [Actinomycetospora sp. CA-101289]|uniref:DEAD/DEAH box helicase n=1 Tax=Actinomycetospora sp. CA-101289 TaxID=3239893 RepID=UPI003D96C92A
MTGADSDADTAYGLLARPVQQWVHRRGWQTLQGAQVQAVAPILEAKSDVLITASTAGGKTEAAFLPILSRLVDQPAKDRGGIDVLYLSPLKALINDQFGRLEEMCADLPIPVHAWHGDIPASRKKQTWRERSGILLITPESVEGLLCHRGDGIKGFLGRLRYVVVDELHAFPGSARGAQLASLLHRLDLIARRRIPRVGLSATVGDVGIASAFLRPGRGERVIVVAAVDAPRERKALLRGSTRGPSDIADRLYRTLRGRTNLVFANRRDEVEGYADRLRRECENARVPNEFFAHHGSLSKAEREDVEERLKSPEPATAICTSTLEMGIDIGQVSEVAQVRCPPSVAALRQRWGRSGRRPGDPSVLRTYISEPALTTRTAPHEALRAELVATVAMLELFRVDDWCEEPESGGLHLSTLVQQVLSLVTQHDGVHPHEAESVLCSHGPFDIDAQTFHELLLAMHDTDLLMSSSDGLLLPGRRGEREIDDHGFLSAFATPDVYRVLAHGEEIGTIDAGSALLPGSGVVLAGRRWRVVAVHQEASEVVVVPDTAGTAPQFPAGGALRVHDRVRARMLELYLGADVPPYLDEGARALLAEGRAMFAQLELYRRDTVPWGQQTVVFPWRGDRVLDTLRIALHHAGLDADREGPALVVQAPEEAVRRLLDRLATAPPPDPMDLAATVPAKVEEKWDDVLSPELLDRAYAARALDVESAWVWLRARAGDSRTGTGSTLTDVPTPVSRPEDEATGAHLELGTTPLAVIAVRPTGLSPGRGHRIVEIAVVTCRPDGSVEDFWHTLLDPDVDVGSSRVHGLVATDVIGAPTFSEIAGDIATRIEGRVLVAHNAPFEIGFLRNEFTRAGHEPPEWPTLCTMALADRASPSSGRSLPAVCAAHGISLPDVQSARDDALATASLLHVQLAALGVGTFADLGTSVQLLPGQWISKPPTGRVLPRVRPAPRTPSELADHATAGETAYADAVLRALDEGELSGAELQDLLRTIRSWSLTAGMVEAVHREVLGRRDVPELIRRRLGVVERTAARLVADSR